MSRLLFLTAVGWVWACSINLLVAADDLHAQVKTVLRIGTRADKTSQELTQEAISLRQKLGESGPLDPRLDYAFGLVLAKHGKNTAAIGSLTPAVEGLEGELGLVSRAILAWSLASQKKHSASLTELETLSEQLDRAEPLNPAFARDLATLCGQLVGFYEGPMAQVSPGQVERIKQSMLEELTGESGVAFRNGIDTVLAEFEKRQRDYDGHKQARKKEQDEKREAMQANLAESRVRLTEERDSLQNAAVREQERIESAKGQLDADYRAVQDEYVAVRGTISQLRFACQQLDREKELCVRRFIDSEGREVVEVNQTRLAWIESQIGAKLLQIAQLQTRQAMLRNRADQLEAAGARVLGHEAATAEAVQRKDAELNKEAQRLQKRATKVLRPIKDETTKSRALRTNMQTLTNYVALPFVAEGKRLLAASKLPE